MVVFYFDSQFIIHSISCGVFLVTAFLHYTKKCNLSGNVLQGNCTLDGHSFSNYRLHVARDCCVVIFYLTLLALGGGGGMVFDPPHSSLKHLPGNGIETEFWLTELQL